MDAGAFVQRPDVDQSTLRPRNGDFRVATSTDVQSWLGLGRTVDETADSARPGPAGSALGDRDALTRANQVQLNLVAIGCVELIDRHAGTLSDGTEGVT